MPSWFDRILYWSCTRICYAVLTLGFSLRVSGGRRIPRDGALLIIANHQSMLDPVLVGLASPRMHAYLARDTLFKNRMFSWLIKRLQAIPVDQEGMAKEGLRAILRALEAGRAVVIFPEGSRTEDGKIGRLMPGISLLVERSGAAVVPVGIAGAYAALPRGQVCPRFSPLFLPAEPSAIAVAVGKPIASQELAGLPRRELLDRLHRDLETVQSQAEKIRRKRSS